MSTRLPKLSDVLDRAIEDALDDVWTALPGVVEMVNDGGNSVDVRLSIKRPINYTLEERDSMGDVVHTEFEEAPVLPSVPVAYTRAGDYFIGVPLEKGHRVLVVFCKHEVGEWWASMKDDPVNPGLFDAQSINGAVAIPGLYPKKDMLLPADLSQSGLRIGKVGGAWDYVALAQKVDDALADLKSYVDDVVSAILGGSPIAQDGGAALLASQALAMPSSPTLASVAADDVEVT